MKVDKSEQCDISLAVLGLNVQSLDSTPVDFLHAETLIKFKFQIFTTTLEPCLAYMNKSRQKANQHADNTSDAF